MANISITTQPTKTTYFEGESFDSTGMVVTATYSDNTTAVVTDYTYVPSGALATTDEEVVVSYGGKSASVSITVNPAITVAAVTGSVNLLGKQPSDLQSSIVIGTDAISGTLNYVSDYTGFSSNVSEQSGNYLALIVTTPSNATVTSQLIGGVHGQVTLDEDRMIVFRVTSTEQSVTFTTTYGSTSKTVTYALTGLTLTAAPSNTDTYEDTVNNISLSITTDPQTGVKTYVLDNDGTETTGVAKASVPTEQGVDTEYFLEYQESNAPKYALARISGTESYTITIIDSTAYYNKAEYTGGTATYVPLTASGTTNINVTATPVANATKNVVIFDSTASPVYELTLANNGVFDVDLGNYGVIKSAIIYSGNKQAFKTNVSVSANYIALFSVQASTDEYMEMLWNTSVYDIDMSDMTFTRTDATISDVNKLSGTFNYSMDEGTGAVVITFTYLDTTTDVFNGTPNADDTYTYTHVE